MQNDHDEVSVDYLCSELSSAFSRVWETAVNIPLASQDQFHIIEEELPWFGAVAWIGGSWTGSVRIGMPPSLARLIACRLLQSENPTREQINDGLRELANMTAGNLKSVLPGRCGLATPGNFQIKAIEEIEDGFSSIMLSWYNAQSHCFFVGLSALHPVS